MDNQISEKIYKNLMKSNVNSWAIWQDHSNELPENLFNGFLLIKSFNRLQDL
jgi:hypothetical protein